MSTSLLHRPLLWLLAFVGLLGAVGCAGIPRIDPSGQRIFLPADPADPNTRTTFESPFGAAPGPSSNNQVAPPVLSGSEPLCPLCPLGGCFDGNHSQPVAGAITRVARKPNETLSITPERVLAPIGSEVILKASVCGENSYLRTNRRIEWMLGNEGAGQFVTVGEQGEMDILRFPWQRPNKHDNSFAVGYTSPFHTCINRGTADRTDDLQIRPGDAWITVTSASEGVSFVTASAPETNNWETRRARATIYWIDAQWSLPESRSVQLGQPHTLVTSVTRKSDGAPVTGWIVEYEVVEGPTARLGYEAGQKSTVTTDAQGRASIQISPTDDQPGLARVKVNVVRPPQSGAMASPRLDIGGGETVIDWTPLATAPTLNEPTNAGNGSGTPPAPFEPAPSLPIGPINPDAQAQLEVKVTRDATGPIKPGDIIPLTITIINTGDTTAYDISFTDKYEAGLTSPFDREGKGAISYPPPGSNARFPDLGPGESETLQMELQAIASGRQCHELTVTAAGNVTAFERQCFNITSPPPPATPQIEIEVAGALRSEVGQNYLFKSKVFNRGTVVAKNVKVDILFEGPLEPIQAETNFSKLSNGFTWTIDSLEPGGSIPFEVLFKCLAETRAAQLTAYAKADGTTEHIKNAAVEIAPARNSSPATGNGGDVSSSPLSGKVRLITNPARVGQPGSLELIVTNNSNTTQRNVEFRLVDEDQLISTRLTTAQSQIPFVVNGNALRFGPVAELPAGQSIAVTVPYDAAQQGTGNISLEVKVNGGNIIPAGNASLTVNPR